MYSSDANKIGQQPRAPRFLENALLFTLFAHAAGMASMFLLLPGMPGAINADLSVRAAYVAAHPWIWRVGWFPWQLTALFDLLLAAGLVRTAWIPKTPALLTVLITLAAMIPDQTGEFAWTWIGTSIARDAMQSNNFARYAAFESRTFLHVAGYAPVGYITGALGWTWCFVAARMWSRSLTVISWITWPMFIVITATVFLPPSFTQQRWVGAAVGLGNAGVFVLLLLWLALVSEIVLRRSRPDASSGRYAIFRHPSSGIFGRLCNLLANSRLVRGFFEFIPALAMDSDITNVIYANYLVEAKQVEHFVDEPLKLQRLGPDGRYALFTFLTFHHGHFGPRCFGPLRKLWPSPIQSNWRIHVFDPATGKRGIQFLTIAIAGTLYSLAARLLAENVPMHVPADARFSCDTDGVFTLEINPCPGTSPDVKAAFQPSPEPALPHPWNECFQDWHAMLAYCVPQDRAMSAQPWRNRVTRQEIILNIPLDSCLPMRGEVDSHAVRAIAGDALPLCFRVERLSFRLLKECHDRYTRMPELKLE